MLSGRSGVSPERSKPWFKKYQTGSGSLKLRLKRQSDSSRISSQKSMRGVKGWL